MEVFWSNPHTTHTEQKSKKLTLASVIRTGQPADRGGPGDPRCPQCCCCLDPEASSQDTQEGALGIFPTPIPYPGHPTMHSPVKGFSLCPPTALALIPGGCVPRVRAEPRIWHHRTMLSVSQTELVIGLQYHSPPSSLCQDGHRHPSCCAQASLTPEVTGLSLRSPASPSFPSQSFMSQGRPFISETDHPCPTAFDCVQVSSSLTSPDLHPLWPLGLLSITCSR